MAFSAMNPGEDSADDVIAVHHANFAVRADPRSKFQRLFRKQKLVKRTKREEVEDEENEDGEVEEEADAAPLVKPTWTKAWMRAITTLGSIIPVAEATMGRRDEGEEKMAKMLLDIKTQMEKEGVEGVSQAVSGLKKFGVSKGLISRAVVTFAAPPGEHPLTLCFHFPNTFLNHSYVRHMVLSTIRKLPGARVVTVQYQDRNVFHGTCAMPNRWIIKVSTREAFDALVAHGIDICQRRLLLKPYDAVLREEYEEYKEYRLIQREMIMDRFTTLSDEIGANEHTRTIIRKVANEVLPDLPE